MRDFEDYRAMDNVSTPLSSFHTLETLNNAEADVRLPSIIFLSVLLLVGICGNFCVWLVYGFKLKKHSTYKLTVLGIAFYDTLACCGGIPGNIIDLRNPLTFYSSVGCKLLRFGLHITAAGSSMTHIVMGADRYRRICCPLSWQLSNKLIMVFHLVIFLLAFIIAAPTFALFDSVEISTTVVAINGHQCGPSVFSGHSTYRLVYEVTLAVFVVVTVTCLIAFYTLIGRTICRRTSMVNTLTNNGSVRSVELPATTVPVKKNDDDKAHNFENENRLPQEMDKREHVNDIGLETGDHGYEIPEVDNEDQKKQHDKDILDIVKQMQLRKSSLRSAKSRKLTLITFLLTLCFIISFVPVLVLLILNNVESAVLDDLTYPEQCTYYVFLVSYTINNVSNPLVYLAMDDEFRHHLKQYILWIVAKCKPRYCA